MLLVLYVSQDLNSSVFHSIVQVELSKCVFHLGSDSFDSFFGEADTSEGEVASSWCGCETRTVLCDRDDIL